MVLKISVPRGGQAPGEASLPGLCHRRAYPSSLTTLVNWLGFYSPLKKAYGLVFLITLKLLSLLVLFSPSLLNFFDKPVASSLFQQPLLLTFSIFILTFCNNSFSTLALPFLLLISFYFFNFLILRLCSALFRDLR